jgi:hypothetical protein
LLYFMTIRNILRPIGIIYGLLVYIVCGHLVCLDQEKSGNPGVRVFCLQTEMSKPSKSVRDRIRTSKVTFTSTSFLQTKTNQGCQIYLGTIYQNEGRFVNWPYTIPDGQLIHIPNGRKIDQVSIKYTNTFDCKALKIYPNWDFRFENIPSGNRETSSLLAEKSARDGEGSAADIHCFSAEMYVHRYVCRCSASIHVCT